MILYMKLRALFAQRPLIENRPAQGKLCGAIINELFGIANTQEPFKSFAAENHALIATELQGLAGNLPEMMIPLTDALRIQAICDFQEGTDSSHLLQKAQHLGLLLTDREMPLPHTFIEMVRRMGSAFGLVAPPAGQARMD